MTTFERPEGIHRSTWAMVVIVSEANEAGQFYVELEDPRHGGPNRVIDRKAFEAGQPVTGWISKASRKYINKRVRELATYEKPKPLHPEPDPYVSWYDRPFYDDPYDYY